LALGPVVARAHEIGGDAAAPERLFPPGVVVPLILTALAYAIGCWRLWRRSSAGRGGLVGRAWCFAFGWIALSLALLSPLDTMGGDLFWVHMTQHEVLMLVAAPLLVLGRPLPAFLWALPVGARPVVAAAGRASWLAACWRGLTRPITAWFAHAVALWGWHAPALFEAALVNRTVHDLQHLTFLATALLFWFALLNERGREGQGAAIVYLFTTTVHSGVLGALITFASHPWYPAYLHTTERFGLTPLEDQQLGGLIMWVPASFVYVGIGLWLLARWVSTSDGRVLR
jgi:putative membrane protein